MLVVKALSSKRKAPLIHDEGDEEASGGRISSSSNKKRGAGGHLIRHTPFVASNNPPTDSLRQKVRARMAAAAQAGSQRRIQDLHEGSTSNKAKVVRPREGEEPNQCKLTRVGDHNLEKANEDNLQGAAGAEHLTRRSFASSIQTQIEEQGMAKRQRRKEYESLRIKRERSEGARGMMKMMMGVKNIILTYFFRRPEVHRPNAKKQKPFQGYSMSTPTCITSGMSGGIIRL